MKRFMVLVLLAAMAGPAAARSPCAAARLRGPELEFALKGTDLAGALKLLAEVAGAPIVVSGEVRGRITMRLRRVPFEQALCTIAGLRQLRVRIERGVYLVTL